MLSGRGGKREGAGRPKGTKNAATNPRKHRSLLARDDEWAAIQSFIKFVRKFGADTATEYLEKFDALASFLLEGITLTKEQQTQINEWFFNLKDQIEDLINEEIIGFGVDFKTGEIGICTADGDD